ncbi:heavy-metal-associated domain-containing protein [Streptomyces sp. NBC_00201]|uniref:heavy-metal-associated domain-containing protein n=1 Tax=unclassified Streptomyces TaxID=2593676 RepID=UPI00224DA0EE|nr:MULTISPECIES: heavy-metal-associated domain-containing protein [unclassified Streptomyces]MCX5250623.1 heavy-metal-associated domain-containing protein [Streptomyces sp. NBC_00201]MCX5291448.1 heavy-metal-associated domain-containing protein [Streptomyces sp. NBC_00183]
MAQKQYLVTGMTCEHCAASITEEVSQVPGVTDVDVDVTAGSVSVGGTDLHDARLRAAIVEAGYEVTETVAA